MKQPPQIIQLRDILDKSHTIELIPDRDEFGNVTVTYSKAYYPFPTDRPESSGGFFTRLELAWGVFTGKYDALKWDN